MAEQKRKPKPKPEEEQAAEAQAQQERDADVDDLLDEIDEVLETNAEEFVKGFVQKGGE